MMRIAREGYREIGFVTLVLAALGLCVSWFSTVATIPILILWVWTLAFFRDPKRERAYDRGEICSACDGRVTEVTELGHHSAIGGPAVRIGTFLSLFNVHVNRSPCAGRVRSVTYRKGEFLDARHRESSHRNESNSVLIDPESPIAGPIEVRQVAGFVARRIVCHARTGDSLATGERFGLIKFGSRTEVIIPKREGTEILVKPGDRVHAGLTIVARMQGNAVEGSAAAAEKVRPSMPRVNQELLAGAASLVERGT